MEVIQVQFLSFQTSDILSSLCFICRVLQAHQEKMAKKEQLVLRYSILSIVQYNTVQCIEVLIGDVCSVVICCQKSELLAPNQS